MNNLITKEMTINSREVAEMVQKQHSELLKDIRRYTGYLNEGNLHLVDFFQESTYLDNKGEERPCYEVTKKGCEFIAHKMTGQKGALFTAEYINRFHEMEKGINQFKGLSKELQAIFAIDQKQQEFNTRLSGLENNMTIDYGQERNLQVLAQSMAIKAIGGKETPTYKDRGLRGKVYASIWRDFKDYFQVASYRNTPKKDYDRAVEFLKDWRLTGKLLRQVEDCNNQIQI